MPHNMPQAQVAVATWAIFGYRGPLVRTDLDSPSRRAIGVGAKRQALGRPLPMTPLASESTEERVTGKVRPYNGKMETLAFSFGKN